MPNKRLVLFDIDGTLLWPDGAGRAALKATLERVYGSAGPIDGFRFGGKTDRWLVGELLRQAGIELPDIWASYERALAVMEDELRERLERGDHDVQPCPGAHALVERLVAHDDVLVGLLTGNYRGTAFVKLRAGGFDPSHFQVGAYGHESLDRASLPALAVTRAAELTGVHFQGQQVVIVGDTPEDVTCGREVGARSIAVLTGWVEQPALEVVNPHYLFDDLTDTEALLDAIFAPTVDPPDPAFTDPASCA
jgi:phosphoglycolate phosphatase-like HAD superfamily hydrolase